MDYRLNALFFAIAIFQCAGILLPTPNEGFRFSHYGAKYVSKELPPLKIDLKIHQNDLNKSVNFGISSIDRLKRLETNLGISNIHIKHGTPSYWQFLESAPESKALLQSKDALIASKATANLIHIHCRRKGLSTADCSKLISTYNLKSTPLHSFCIKNQKICSYEEIHSKYRSIDGSCNHKPEKWSDEKLSDGNLGKSFTSYKRLIHSNYLDGIHVPRRSVTKRVLPSPRLVSTNIAKNIDTPHHGLTLAVMQWSEFVANDLSHTSTTKMVHTDQTIECCDKNGYKLWPRYTHPFCSPIDIPGNDEFYFEHDLECMSYVRSMPALRPDCTFGPVEQLNQATHFLDGSQIYGSELDKSLFLRKKQGGLLKYSKLGERIFLPESRNPSYECLFSSNGTNCFIAGDLRSNTHLQLTAMHTIWLREHNRIATGLSQLNPEWNDETLFQETRRIVIAELQHITYHEWLPVILGEKYASLISGINANTEETDPSVSNSFATAASRFMKSLMDSKLTLYGEDRNMEFELKLKDFFNKPSMLEQNGFLDGIIRGLATQNSQKLDANYAGDVTTLFHGNGKIGLDAFSLDIQRGRDHGLPGYNAFRDLCGLNKATKFEDFLDVMSQEAVRNLSKVYDHPEDVDLIVGGMLEFSSMGSLMGPTFSCITADQMLRSRVGDRYFYLNKNQPEPMTPRQVLEIEKVSLARLFCDNGDKIQMMQPKVFRSLSESNILVSCSSPLIASIDLRMWSSNDNYFRYLD